MMRIRCVCSVASWSYVGSQASCIPYYWISTSRESQAACFSCGAGPRVLSLLGACLPCFLHLAGWQAACLPKRLLFLLPRVWFVTSHESGLKYVGAQRWVAGSLGHSLHHIFTVSTLPGLSLELMGHRQPVSLMELIPHLAQF